MCLIAPSMGGRQAPQATARRAGVGGAGVLDRIAGLQTGDHVCWTYATDAEHRQVLTTFFAEGVARGEKVFYLADDNAGAGRLLDALGDEGQPVDRLQASGQLVVKVGGGGLHAGWRL